MHTSPAPIAERTQGNPAQPLQTYLPFEFFPDREPEMYACMRHIRREAGIRSSMSYSPLDPGFREAFLEQFRIVAEIAKPDMIVLEDDYQFSNHGSVGFGCFCEMYCENREWFAVLRDSLRDYEVAGIELVSRSMKPSPC